MKFDWKTLLAQLANALVEIFGESFRKWFESMFSNIPAPDGDGIILVGDAPDQLKSDLEKKLRALVTKAFANKPVILRFALLFVNNLPWSFVDDIYDRIFATEITAGTRTAAAGAVRPMTASPVLCTGPDLDAAKLEAGIPV